MPLRKVFYAEAEDKYGEMEPIRRYDTPTLDKEGHLLQLFSDGAAIETEDGSIVFAELECVKFVKTTSKMDI